MMASAVTVSYDASSSEEEVDDGGSDTSHDEESEEVTPSVPRPSDPSNNVLDSQSESDDSASSNDESGTKQGSGLANVMAQILGKKVAKEKKVPILSKGTTDKQITQARKRKEAEEEDTEESKKKKKTEKESDEESSDDDEFEGNEKKKLWEEMGRLKPSIADKNRERILQRTATKGVVQLFNAVKKQQKLIDDQLTQVGNSEIRKDKVMKSMTKGKFIDVLKKTGANVSAEPVKDTDRPKQKRKRQKHREEEKDENPSWSILRDDFMMGAKMKDWDKEDDEGNEPGDDDGNYSDSDT